jgi:hypothetical protein
VVSARVGGGYASARAPDPPRGPTPEVAGMRALRIGALLIVTLSLLAACSSGGGGSSNQAAFCNTLKKANADKSLNSSGTPTKEQTAKIEKVFSDLADNAPSDISSDIGVLKDAIPKIASNSAAFQKDTKAVATVQTASAHLQTYSKDKCKVDLSSG